MRALRLWGPAVAYMALVYIGSSIPSPPVPPSVSDKVLHLASYAVLAVLLARALVGGLPARLPLRTAALAVGLAVAYGAGLEVRQAFLVARTADLDDAYANAAGACAGVFACWLWGTIASGPARPGGRPT
jgi:VanZ family protein